MKNSLVQSQIATILPQITTDSLEPYISAKTIILALAELDTRLAALEASDQAAPAPAIAPLPASGAANLAAN
jgi:hypothetical protein